MIRHIGLVGAGRIGGGLARNLRRHGVQVVIYDQDPVASDVASLEALVEALPRPRVVLLCLPSAAVDAVRGSLRLEEGDVLVDAGNAHPDDTRRRCAEGGLHVGLGVSGGPRGAETGPALMAGGPEEARRLLVPLLSRVAARVRGEPCLAWLGPAEAGHLVKMVHNGIEYAEMQVLAEAHLLLSRGLGLSRVLVEATLESWSRGALSSFLLDVTRDGLDLAEEVVDRAGGLGTGRWTVEEALRVGVPVPSITAAVTARALSRQEDLRRHLDTVGRRRRVDGTSIDDIGNALLAARFVHLAQGLDLLQTAGRARGFELDPAWIVRTWRGGCILRSALLGPLSDLLAEGPMLEHPLVQAQLRACLPGWRRTVGGAVGSGLPVPALSAGLGYIDGLSAARGTAAMIQAQRHLFGGHPVERVATGHAGS